MSPQRIQMRRTKGWRKPEGAVYVGRPSKWGNPFVVHPGGWGGCDRHDFNCVMSSWDAVTKYRHSILWPIGGQPRVPTPDYIRQQLRGRDLACWCPLDQPCHADVLLELANEESA